ncbi:hypothetical protein [Vibrio alginolyticus]|uniref:hypothetical protein n=1 Tax=Vibrio alginolyticus TaxID=663 RepID=UPI003754F0E0
MRDDFEKIVLYEGMSPRGHVELTKFYIECLKNLDTQLFVGNSLKHHFTSVNKVVFFDDKLLRKGRLLSSFSFILNTLRVFTYCRMKGIKKITFLSYNANVMFLMMWVANLIGLKVYCFEHNTVPDGSRLKLLLQKMCTSRLHRICYMPQIVSLYEKINLKAEFIPHPFLNIKASKLVQDCDSISRLKKEQLVIFVPSGLSDIERVKKQAIKNPDKIFVVKTKFDIDLSNVTTKKFFENYYDVLKACDIVYFPIDFNYRVSGPFYEAIAFGKPIVIEGSGNFKEFARSEFPEYILENFQSEVNLNNIDRERYNEEVKNKLLKVVNQ